MKKIIVFIIFSLHALSGATALASEGESNLLELYNYKPIYFLMGTSYTKIEFSFKTQVVKSIPVYFGYTQLMMWDLFTPSPYFYDINYNPLVWYRFNIDGSENHWLDLIPFEHESNGKGGTQERTWNRIGASYHQVFSVGDHSTLYFDFKAWIPFMMSLNNANIAQYRGVWELQLTLSKFLGPFFDFNDLELRFYPGGPSYTDPLRGGQELTLRLRSKLRDFLPFALVQVFHGYGQYLLDDQNSMWGVRAGIGF